MSRLTVPLIATVALICGASGHAQGPRQPPATFQIVEASVAQIHAAYRAGTLTARALTQQYLDRIEAYDRRGPMLNSIIIANPKALEDADRLDAQFKKSGPVGLMHGIPILVKDEIDTAGMPTTLGTLVFKDYRPPKDAFVIEKLRKAGAIILGKTTLSEFAAGDTYGSMFGFGLPTGMSFFGLAYSEPTLLKLAYAYEHGTRHRAPPKTTPPLARTGTR